MFDIKKVAEDAQKEINDEKADKAKALIKDKMRAIAKAEQVVSNLKRELDDLYADIGRQTL